MESDSNSTFYHIFTRIRIQIRMFSNTNTKRTSRIRMHIQTSTRFERQHLPIFFIGNLQLRNHVKTKILVHNRDSSLRISHSSIFILIINDIINKTINKYIFEYIYTFIKQIIKIHEKYFHQYINKLE
jgi:hypothetical protein